MEVYYEKREYPQGVQFVPVTNFIPGNVYFVQRMDEYNQMFYTQASAVTTYTGYPMEIQNPVPIQTQVPIHIPGPEITTTTTVYTNNNQQQLNCCGCPITARQAKEQHLGITVTSIFFSDGHLFDRVALLFC